MVNMASTYFSQNGRVARWRYPLFLIALVTPLGCSSALAESGKRTQAGSHPPAYLSCSLYVGESELLESICRVTTLSGGRMLIEDDKRVGYRLLIKPIKYKDKIFWNQEPNGKKPTRLLGVAQWIDNCWRSVQRSDPAFFLCLIPPRVEPQAPVNSSFTPGAS